MSIVFKTEREVLLENMLRDIIDKSTISKSDSSENIMRIVSQKLINDAIFLLDDINKPTNSLGDVKPDYIELAYGKNYYRIYNNINGRGALDQAVAKQLIK